MLILSKEHKNKLHDLGVEALYLFGSRAQGIDGPLSDYDFAVLTKKESDRRGWAIYDAIYDLLSPFCPRTQKNDVIDIVFLRHAPLELKMHIVRYGQVLFDENPRARAKFEEETTLLYCDFRPILDIFDKAILKTL